MHFGKAVVNNRALVMATTENNAPTQFDCYSTEEVMRILKFGPKSQSNFWACVHNENIPRVQINARRYLFPKAAFEQWFRSRSIGVTTDSP